MTKVFNLSTGEERLYTLPFKEAIICAQMNSEGKNNTWAYDFSRNVPLSLSGRTAGIGDWCCILPIQDTNA